MIADRSFNKSCKKYGEGCRELSESNNEARGTQTFIVKYEGFIDTVDNTVYDPEASEDQTKGSRKQIRRTIKDFFLAAANIEKHLDECVKLSGHKRCKECWKGMSPAINC